MANSEQQALAWLRHLEIARPGAVASQPSSGPIHYFAPPRERHRLRTRRRHSIRERHADGCDRGIAFFMTTTLLPGECGYSSSSGLRSRPMYSFSCSVSDPHAWPNHALDRTARKRRLRVPSSLRSSAAGQRERWAAASSRREESTAELVVVPERCYGHRP